MSKLSNYADKKTAMEIAQNYDMVFIVTCEGKFKVILMN